MRTRTTGRHDGRPEYSQGPVADPDCEPAPTCVRGRSLSVAARYPSYFSASRSAKYAGFGRSSSSHGSAAPSPGKNAGIQEYLSV